MLRRFGLFVRFLVVRKLGGEGGRKSFSFVEFNFLASCRFVNWGIEFEKGRRVCFF